MSQASQCFDYSDDAPTRNLYKLQKLPLDDKILYSQVKIKEFYLAMKGKVSVSFSGGKDSTVLLHLVRQLYPDVPATFFDTGLEYPEIREHVKSVENVVWLKPKMSFKKVIETQGYPVVGKNVALWIGRAQRGTPGGIKQSQLDTRYGVKKYAYLIDAPFKISNNCCDIMKKNPAREYYKETGRCPYIGMRADEGGNRTKVFMDIGENNLEKKIPSSNPILIWTSKDIWEYIRRYNLPYASIYDKGVDRTGCIFCMFGIMHDQDRFLKLKQTHPDLWEYCMKDKDKGGLGMKQVLDFIKIPSGCEQSNIEDFGTRIKEQE